jgi:type IV pilus assembly protein PilE
MTMPMPLLRQHGFTLLEVMITVAIVAILAAIALPSYADYVTRSRIVEATNALADYRNRMEKYFLDHRSYVDGGGACAMANDMATVYNAQPDHYFAMSCPDVTATTYTLRATGGGPMTGFVYEVTESNAKSTPGTPSGWNAPNPNNCWALRKDGSCS